MLAFPLLSNPGCIQQTFSCRLTPAFRPLCKSRQISIVSKRLLLIGRTLSHYRITSAIGAGGMGQVYRAADTKLQRDVALKVLPSEMASDPDRLARFQREARVVASLNHPQIVTIFSVEESDGLHFLTMELIEGESLDRVIPSNGLPIERILEIGAALAGALAAAHEQGIVHRDLKPSNVMVKTDGSIKVLDFGLAKDIRSELVSNATLTSAGQTQAGVVMGTPAYMSPEQIAGREIDHRTDIFSLGVVLHEMSTGHRPFEESSSAELMSAILRDAPSPVTDLRPDLPADLARIIRRCMEKDVRHRVQTARDVSNEFRDLARHTTESPSRAKPPSTREMRAADSGAARTTEGFWIAVLPFKSSGTNTELNALAEGISEEIVTGLSRFSYLRVVARGSTLRYANQTVDLREVGAQLGARYVIEGKLRQSGIKLRVAVQLVDTSSGAHLWAETYDRPFSADDFFAIQDELVPIIVSTVADQYGVLPRKMSEALHGKDESQLTPYEAVLRGFAYFERLTADSHARALSALERVTQQAPEVADCWAMLSMLYRGQHVYGFKGEPDPLGRALIAARRAVELGPANHLAYFALAATLFFQKDRHGFRVAAKRCIELNPMDGSTIAYLGFLIAGSGDWDDGTRLVESAAKLNPFHPSWYYLGTFFNFYRQRKYREALDAALAMNIPASFHTHATRVIAFGQLSLPDEAKKPLRELLALRPDFANSARFEYSKFYDSDVVEHILEGLRKAGLDVPVSAATPAP
ncbi:MAG TPA: protein kinase [Candidatus Sulfotelmatobacter sp.]|nr:protein kinase [Candidatus Sulfotelmatobacter sp.]